MGDSAVVPSPVPAVEARGIVKRFGDRVANDGIDLAVGRGEVFAIVGENGAGKSTLMHVLYGLLRPDAGEIRIDGEPVALRSPRDAIAAGLGMVHQHFTLVGPLTVAENVVLGNEPRARGRFDVRAAEARVALLAQEVGFEVDPGAPVSSLPVGAQQRVEILKALSRGARTLILDEPTAVLTPGEVDDLFRALRRLVDGGRTLLFISHKLREVLSIAERVAVMRAGRLVATHATRDTDARTLSAEMVGREPAPSAIQSPRESTSADGSAPAETATAIALRLDHVRVLDDRGLFALDDLCLSVREGEIVGIAGVEGNGQAELVEVVTGLRPAAAGRVENLGKDRTGASPAAIADAGVAHVPGDRLRRGIVATMTVEENLLLGRHREPRFRGPVALRRDAIASHARETMEAFDVRPRDPTLAAGRLSGGNQQKLVLGRELGRRPRLLVAMHPTRGVDLGAVEQIHARLAAERARGTAVLLVSSELSELLTLSDRIAVLYRGRIAHETAAAAADERRLGAYMTGAGAA